MPLSRALLPVLLTSPCPHCRHRLEKKGGWFQSVSHYRCGACHQEVSVSYEDKVKLFDDHAHLGRR
jgi:transposase-like protein